MQRIAMILIAGLALPACFSPTFPDCQITCGSRHNCPDDSICDEGLCRRPAARTCLSADAAQEPAAADTSSGEGPDAADAAIDTAEADAPQDRAGDEVGSDGP